MKNEPKTTTPVNFEEKTRIATISDETRDYLVIFGRLTDVENDFCALVDRDYGETQTDHIVDDFRQLMCKVRMEVEKNIIWSITEKLFTLDSVQI